MQDSYLNSPIMYSIAFTLIHFIWQGGLVALALKTALMFTPHKKSQLRYGFSALAMVLNFALPIITFFTIYNPTYQQFNDSLSNISAAGADFNLLISQQSEWYINVIEYLPYLTLIWMSIICILSLKLLLELYAVNQLPSKGTLSPSEDLLERFQQLVKKIGLVNTPKILLSLNTDVPMAIGWLKPVVLIPVSMLTGLTPAQLDMLILHELAHIRRHDYLVNFIQTIVEIVLFYHPAVLWVSNQMRNEREYCSDDIAVHHCGNPIAYAHTLADTASICRKHRKRSIPGMAMAASGGDLTQRVLRLVDEPHCSTQNNVSKWLASLTILFIVFFASSHQLIKLTDMDITSSNLVFDEHSDILQELEPTEIETSALVSPKSIKDTQLEIKNQHNEFSATPSLAVVIDTGESLNLSTPDESIIAIKASQNDTNTNQINETTIINDLPLSTSSPIAFKDKQIKNQSIEAKLSIEPNERKSLLDAPTKTKSISDIAFEKTDSTLSISKTPNKYAKEINSLTTNFEIVVLPSSLVTNSKNKSQSKPIVKPQTNKNILPSQKDAKLIFSPAPKYPSTAKRKGIELEVKIDFTIDKKGNVRDIKFHPKNKVNYFRAAVRSAIEKWKFEPAKYNGKAVDSNMSKIFSFSLER